MGKWADVVYGCPLTRTNFSHSRSEQFCVFFLLYFQGSFVTYYVLNFDFYLESYPLYLTSYIYHDLTSKYERKIGLSIWYLLWKFSWNFYFKPYSYVAFFPLQVSAPSRKTQEVYANWKLKLSKTKQSIENLKIPGKPNLSNSNSNWSNDSLRNKIPSFILTKENFWAKVGPIWDHCSYCIASHMTVASQSSKKSSNTFPG